ncbi:BrnA antitoxin family protein [Gluconobacter albidus]|uniref:BrnA antitoxin family protein n=1 Tax=Gluconobacter albidus TaxID=318683 RepID=UPI002012D69F|nr:BrnA antitoxin family protein [Gluconobacter albidus]
MNAKNNSGKPEWVDPDDAPELTDVFFEAATVRSGKTVVRRGRPTNPHRKQQVTLRLDADVLDAFKRQGAGWQTRINEALKASLSH